ncbi:FUSC family protein [Micromonospora lutea]|uniref:FUSC family protein n=1 Tax=Micromonospora lutea TaxID=419825 RepID=A0ABQ4J2S0_9ACTN|nr:FUSC family protein [Micromonospora lutea]GIJ24472.1 FUSC family protein [Micromonospora lutea]
MSRRWISVAWPLAQQSAAAVVAWLIAVHVAGHAEPFFAPVAAAIGLNATQGRRGSNAVRLLTGVLIGVLVGEAAVWLVGGGAWTLAVAAFLAMLVARLVNDARIIQAQAAVAAILVTVFGQPEQGWDRLVDAFIGAGVAVVFSQVLFAPEPLRLLRHAEAAVLSSLADALRMTADAFESGDEQRAAAATTKLRDLRDKLAALSTTRKASDRIVRHSLTWRRRAGLVVAERERADHLDLLAGSCLMLARTALAIEGPLRAPLAAVVRQLAAAMDGLATDPGDRPNRQHAADRAAELARWLVEHGGQVPARSPLAAAYASIRMVAADVMVFAGVDPEQAFQDTFPRRREE